jgi:hypothetical protein
VRGLETATVALGSAETGKWCSDNPEGLESAYLRVLG